MDTMNIALPENLKTFVQHQVETGGYSSVSEYVRELIRKDQKAKAREALDAVEQTFALLASMPHMGQACEFRSPRAQGLRRWRGRGSENYLLFSHPHENGVAIIRVLYGARDLESIFEDS